jgi:hypothetical protein
MKITLAGAVVCDTAIPAALIKAIFCTRRRALLFSAFLAAAVPVIPPPVGVGTGWLADVLRTPPDASEGPDKFFKCGCQSWLRAGHLVCPVCKRSFGYLKKVWPSAQPPLAVEQKEVDMTTGSSTDGAVAPSGVAGGSGGGEAPPPVPVNPKLKQSSHYCSECGASYNSEEASFHEFVCPRCISYADRLDDLPPMTIKRRPPTDAPVADVSPKVETTPTDTGAGAVAPAIPKAASSGAAGLVPRRLPEALPRHPLGASWNPRNARSSIVVRRLRKSEFRKKNGRRGTMITTR